MLRIFIAQIFSLSANSNPLTSIRARIHIAMISLSVILTWISELKPPSYPFLYSISIRHFTGICNSTYNNWNSQAVCYVLHCTSLQSSSLLCNTSFKTSQETILPSALLLSIVSDQIFLISKPINVYLIFCFLLFLQIRVVIQIMKSDPIGLIINLIVSQYAFYIKTIQWSPVFIGWTSTS